MIRHRENDIHCRNCLYNDGVYSDVDRLRRDLGDLHMVDAIEIDPDVDQVLLVVLECHRSVVHVC